MSVELIGAIGSILVSLVTLLVMYFVKRDQTLLIKAQTELTVTQAALTVANEALHREINSRMTELLNLTRKESKAEGRLEEKTERAKKIKKIR